jgi:hypothetical protein
MLYCIIIKITTTQETKDWTTWTSQISECELRCPGRVNSFCVTSGTEFLSGVGNGANALIIFYPGSIPVAGPVGIIADLANGFIS